MCSWPLSNLKGIWSATVLLCTKPRSGDICVPAHLSQQLDKPQAPSQGCINQTSINSLVDMRLTVLHNCPVFKQRGARQGPENANAAK